MSMEIPGQPNWEKFSEPHAVDRLREEGVQNIELAFEIPEEKDIDGETIEAKIDWIKFGSPDVPESEEKFPSIEGKLYEPTEPNGEIIIFTPGFPGGNAGRFEQRYAKAFTDDGYTFFTIRHNGTSLTNGAVSGEILNSEKRMEIAKRANEHHIGGTREEGYRPDEMINEPVTAILSLQGRFQKIHLMGQSMGVASEYNAATKLNGNEEVMGKLGNIIGIAGYVGGEQGVPDGVWHGMKDFDGKGKFPDGMDGLIQYELGYVKSVDLNFALDAAGFRDSLAKVASANENMKVPDHVGNVLVFTPEDPLVAGPVEDDAESLMNYGPKTNRKLVIEDKTGMGLEKPHSMLWIEPKNLLRAVKAEVPEHGPHFIKVPNKIMAAGNKTE